MPSLGFTQERIANLLGVFPEVVLCNIDFLTWYYFFNLVLFLTQYYFLNLELFFSTQYYFLNLILFFFNLVLFLNLVLKSTLVCHTFNSNYICSCLENNKLKNNSDSQSEDFMNKIINLKELNFDKNQSYSNKDPNDHVIHPTNFRCV